MPNYLLIVALKISTPKKSREERSKAGSEPGKVGRVKVLTNYFECQLNMGCATAFDSGSSKN